MIGLNPQEEELKSTYQAVGSRGSDVLWMLEELDAYLDCAPSRPARAGSQANGGSF